MNTKTLACTVALILAGAQIASAQSVTINPYATGAYQINTQYTGPVFTGYGYSGGYGAIVGEYYAPGGSVDIMTFQLPTLPAGDVFTSSSLQIQLLGIVNNGNLSDADLYALNVAPTAVVDGATQYYQGATTDPNATLIQASYLTPSSTVRTDVNTGPFVTTSAGAGTTLANYLNTVDVNNSTAGDYLTLRISYDQSPISGYNEYNILDEAAGGTFEKPALTLDYAEAPLVPEPSTYALLGLGSLVLLIAARRRSVS